MAAICRAAVVGGANLKGFGRYLVAETGKNRARVVPVR